jgi:hypothetical protein
VPLVVPFLELIIPDVICCLGFLINITPPVKASVAYLLAHRGFGQVHDENVSLGDLWKDLLLHYLLVETVSVRLVVDGPGYVLGAFQVLRIWEYQLETRVESTGVITGRNGKFQHDPE